MDYNFLYILLYFRLNGTADFEIQKLALSNHENP